MEIKVFRTEEDYLAAQGEVSALIDLDPKVTYLKESGLTSWERLFRPMNTSTAQSGRLTLSRR